MEGTPVSTKKTTTKKVVSKAYNAQIMNSLRTYLRREWHGMFKFIANDLMAKRLVERAVNSGEIMIPSTMTTDEFKAIYQPKIYKAMSDLRHNGQSRARQRYLGTYLNGLLIFVACDVKFCAGL